jgi:hypothetical protein
MAKIPITSIPVMARSISSADDHLLAEQDAIRLGVADITFAWASIENALVDIFFRVLSGVNISIVSTIYFTPASIETRQRIVDNTLRQLIVAGKSKDPLLEEWAGILVTLNRLRKTRNKIAHGEMIISTSIKGSASARLVGPRLKLDQFNSSFMEAYFRGQKPGLGSNELRTAGRAANKAATRLITFGTYLDLAIAGDDATLLQKLAEVKGGSPNPPDRDTQTPPEP